MQDCLHIDLPPHTDPYHPSRPVGMYPSMPLSPPGQTVAAFCFMCKSNVVAFDALLCLLQAAAP